MEASLGVTSLRGFSLNKKKQCYFSYGIASGDPLKDRVILRTRLLPGDGLDRSLNAEWQQILGSRR